MRVFSFKALVCSILIVAAAEAVFATSEGRWGNLSRFEGCPDDHICAEWLQPGSPEDGTFCCVALDQVSSHDMSDCAVELFTPRDEDKAVEVLSKAEASADLQALFAEQEATEARRGQPGIQLTRRSVSPARGIEAELLEQQIDAERPALVLLGLDRFPSAEQWKAWRGQGLELVHYLQDRYWLVQLTINAERAAFLTGAASLTAYLPADKVDPRLDNVRQQPEFFDAERHLVVIHVRLVPSAIRREGEALRRQYHLQDIEHVASTDPNEVTLVTHPSTVGRLRDAPDVVSIRPGVWQVEPLMDGVRAVAKAETVIGGDGMPLTGYGIRAATNEVLGYNWAGKIHDAFWNHDAAGNKTTPRYTPLGESAACGFFNSPNEQHGMMTAGVLLGNGWHSDVYIEDPLGFRGIAPEATFDCYSQSGAHAHVSSHSYTSGPSNSTVVGLSSVEKHHPHVVALGNDGLKRGYYSVRNPQKNLLGVANAQVNGEIYAGSSAGPTNDGRIKPDLSAPTGNANVKILAGGFSVEIYRVRVIRTSQVLLDWDFAWATPEGWGQTASLIGRAGVDVIPMHGRIRVDIDEEIPGQPWGGWGGTPVVGTEVDPQGVPLNFIGQANDTLRVEYRAHGLGYFDLTPTWFRDHPNVQPNCPAIDGSNDCPWDSQSKFGGIGIGDGQLRTMDIPVGQAGDWSMVEGIYWDDELTWANEPIQFLGFRLKSILKQSAPSYSQYYEQGSGGTSGASPVLGGAYALAMENLVRIYDQVDLDERLQRSVYYRNSEISQVYGMPLNSTWKALFIHTADDMIRTFEPTDAPPNVDTGFPNIYYAGPDYTTGYGMVDVQSAVGLMNREREGDAMFDIVEYEMRPGTWHSYPLEVTDAYAAGEDGLKVTLVWDDAPSSNSLVNNLGLALRSPDGTIYFPWSIDVPPFPEPAVTDIVPARRDQPNDRDNVEQVQIDDVPLESGGIWQILVIDNGMGDPSFPQKYSLVTSPWNVEGQCHTCLSPGPDLKR